MRYLAYGLELRSSFALPGMEPQASRGLPQLTMKLTTPSELERAWSGTSGPAAWRGRLGDGCEMTVERGNGGDLLFCYGDRARFRLDASRESLDCAPADDHVDWQWALISKVLCNVSIIRGYEALHAGVVDSADGVVAFAAPSGTGKSTLTSEFVRRGWRLFADDVLMLARERSGVRAFPATPHMSVAKSVPAIIESEDLGASAEEERWLALKDASHESRPVRMLCLLQRGPGLALEAKALPANPLLLAPYMLGFQGDTERQRGRFDLYADLIGSAALVRLTGDPGDAPGDLADVLEGALGTGAALAGCAR